MIDMDIRVMMDTTMVIMMIEVTSITMSTITTMMILPIKIEESEVVILILIVTIEELVNSMMIMIGIRDTATTHV
jgi:hypothetical protein